jgi:hypothetical protein
MYGYDRAHYLFGVKIANEMQSEFDSLEKRYEESVATYNNCIRALYLPPYVVEDKEITEEMMNAYWKTEIINKSGEMFNYITAINAFGEKIATQMLAYRDKLVIEHTECLHRICDIKQEREAGTYVYSEVDFLILEESKEKELSSEIDRFWERVFLE